MSVALQKLKALYSEYIAQISLLEREYMSGGGVWRGMLGGAKPGMDSCNDRFAIDIEAFIGGLCKTKPGSEVARRAIEFALKQSALQPQNSPAGVMLLAVQGCFVPLAGFLRERDARGLIEQYFEHSPLWSLLPAQKELLSALKSVFLHK